MQRPAQGGQGHMTRQSRSLRKSWPVLLFLALGLCAYVFRVLDWFSSVPGDVADGRLNNALLEHLFLWTRGETDGLWNTNFFYPFKDTLAYSDTHLGSGVFYVLARYAGFDRLEAYQIWFLIGQSLNVIFGYVALRRLGLSAVAAGAGAFVFAFSIGVIARTDYHSQLTYRFPAIMAFAAFWQYSQDWKPRRIPEATAWASLQFLCNVYLGVFLVLLLLPYALWILVSKNLKIPEKIWGGLKRTKPLQGLLYVAVVVISLSSLAWMFANYSDAKHLYGFERSDAEVWSMLPRWQSYLLADSSAIWGPISRGLGQNVPMRHEQQLFFGLGVILLSAAGALISLAGRTPFRQLGRASVFALVFLMALTLATRFGSLYTFVLSIPGFDAIRAVARVNIILYLPLAILTAISIHAFLEKTRKAYLAAAVPVLLLTPEVWALSVYNTSVAEMDGRAEQFAKKVDPYDIPEGGVFLITDDVTEMIPAIILEIDALIYAQDNHLRTINGYSGNVPPSYQLPYACLSPFARLQNVGPYKRDTAPPIAEVLETLVLVRLAPCPWEPPAVLLEGNVPDEVIAGLKAQIRPANEPGKYVLTLENTSDEYFSTTGIGPNPVRLSWRWIDSSNEAAAPGWDARRELGFGIPPKETLTLVLDLPPRTGPEDDVFEVSFVHEGVHWFHDAGFEPPRMSPPQP